MTASVSLDAVWAGYAGHAALRAATVNFAQGTVTGIVGPNGAGKTTLLRVALGLLPAQSGTVRVLDRPLQSWSREALARAAAYLPQGADAQWPLLARDVAALGRLPHRGIFARETAQDADVVEDALTRCDAQSFAARRMDELSAGERARVLFARALATGAPVLFADEPAAHLDPAHQLRLMELLREEAARGTAVAVTLHDLSLAARYCDEIIVLHDGLVAAQGNAEAALSDATLAAVFGVAALRNPDPVGGSGALMAWRRL